MKPKFGRQKSRAEGSDPGKPIVQVLMIKGNGYQEAVSMLARVVLRKMEEQEYRQRCGQQSTPV